MCCRVENKSLERNGNQRDEGVVVSPTMKYSIISLYIIKKILKKCCLFLLILTSNWFFSSRNQKIDSIQNFES